jgi:hypothetical protein
MFCGVDTVCAIFAYYVLTRRMRHSGKACQIGTKRLAGPWKRRQGESSRNRGTATPADLPSGHTQVLLAAGF